MSAATSLVQPTTTLETTSIENLTDKTMFLSLEFNRFGNTRKADVEAKTEARQDRFTHNKTLLDSPELALIVKADNALKMWIDAPTRCWRYSRAIRMVPVDILENVYQTLVHYQKIDRPKLVQDFVDAYAQAVDNAKVELKEQFNPKDYPTVEQIKNEFSFSFQFLSFSTPSKLKSISPALYEAEKEKAKEIVLSAVQDMKDGMRVILKDMVDHLMDALTPSPDGKKKKLYSTAVTKLQEFISNNPLLTANNDADLLQEVAKLQLIMQGVDVEKIRESDNLKADLVSKMKDVSTNMATLVEVKGRKFR